MTAIKFGMIVAFGRLSNIYFMASAAHVMLPFHVDMKRVSQSWNDIMTRREMSL